MFFEAVIISGYIDNLEAASKRLFKGLINELTEVTSYPVGYKLVGNGNLEFLLAVQFPFGWLKPGVKGLLCQAP